MFERFLGRMERKYGRYSGIRKLMEIVVIGMGLVYLADYLLGSTIGFTLSSYLYFNRELILQGQVWRLVTFIFDPPAMSLLFAAIKLAFYWYLGTSIQNTWGTFRFTAFYLCGMVGAIIAGFITGFGTNDYLNLSLFLACAILFPETEVNLIIVPVKMKWLALLYLLPLTQNLILMVQGADYAGILALAMSLINILIFFFDTAVQQIQLIKRRAQWKKNWRR